jgi:hypothetical protein
VDAVKDPCDHLRDELLREREKCADANDRCEALERELDSMRHRVDKVNRAMRMLAFMEDGREPDSEVDALKRIGASLVFCVGKRQCVTVEEQLGRITVWLAKPGADRDTALLEQTQSAMTIEASLIAAVQLVSGETR